MGDDRSISEQMTDMRNEAFELREQVSTLTASLAEARAEVERLTRERDDLDARLVVFQTAEAVARSDAASARAAIKDLIEYAHIVADGGGTLGTLRRIAREARRALGGGKG